MTYHSDRGSQNSSINYTERQADADVDPSVASVGDRQLGALAESVIGLVKAEVIRQFGPWKTMHDVEWQTVHRVDKDNTDPLLGSIGYIPPTEAEHRHPGRMQPMARAA